MAIWSRARGELLHCFHQRRALQRPLSSLAPQAYGLLDQSGFGAVTRKQFRLTLGDLRELALKRLGDASSEARVAARAVMCRRLRPAQVRA